MLKFTPVVSNPYENTYEALKLLINNSIYSQENKKYYIENKKSYLKEFCTIKLCTSRQTGHTTAAIKLCNEYFEKSLFLCNTMDMAKRIKKSQYNKNITFGTITNFHDIYRGMWFDAIIIDCACFVGNSKIDAIYDELGPCLNDILKFVILIQ